jgi:hypothetical protein
VHFVVYSLSYFTTSYDFLPCVFIDVYSGLVPEETRTCFVMSMACGLQRLVDKISNKVNDSVSQRLQTQRTSQMDDSSSFNSCDLFLWQAARGRRKLPMPETFPAATQISVSCRSTARLLSVAWRQMESNGDQNHALICLSHKSIYRVYVYYIYISYICKIL